ncbi:MAG: NAD(+)/NADH kinase [Clostridia bacterium]|nr:NAD(+)/NADH kinase [Clostridia bacterium]
MKLFLIPNGLTPERRNSARAAILTLTQRFECLLSPEDAAWLPETGCRTGSPGDCDLICSIGGDGTVLHAAHFAVDSQKPLFGINMGRRGYLCAFGRDEIDCVTPESVQNLLPSERTLLALDKAGGQPVYAVNDFIIAKSDFGSTIDVAASASAGPAYRWQCDGIVISTPTGSTGYTASCGGPLLLPDSPCFVMTAICPMGNAGRSIVYPDSSTLTLGIRTRLEQHPAALYADGKEICSVPDTVSIRKYHDGLTLLTQSR